jgi:hypothetical protein
MSSHSGTAGFSALLDQITLRLDQEMKAFGGYLTVTVDGQPANSVYQLSLTQPDRRPV